MYGNYGNRAAIRSYYKKRMDAFDREREHEAAIRKAKEQEENPMCVLCDCPATHESSAGIGWVCDSDHPELD